MRTHLLWPLGLVAALLSPAAAFAAPLSSLTLEAALERAAQNHPSIAAAAKEVEAAQAATRQAGARPNPELNASIEDMRPESRMTTISVDIPLELGGKRTARLNAAQRAADVARAQLDGARAELRGRVIEAWFAVLVAQERARLAAGSAALAERAADAVARRVAAGKVSPVEATRAGVDLANVRLEADEAAAELATARFALATLIGDDTEPVIDAEAAPPQRPPFAALAAQLDAAPALQIGRLETERRRALIGVERSKATPDLTLSLGGKRDAASGRSLAVIGFSMPLPLFDRNQGAVVEASRRAAQADDQLQAARLQLLADLQQASSRLAIATNSLRSLQATVLPAAQQAFEAAGKGFDAGKFGFLDVIDAQRSLLQARSRYLNTLAAAYQAAAAIDRLTGR